MGATENTIKKCVEQGMQEARVYVWGPGPGRETAIRRVHEMGIRVTLIRDITSLPHNGCRSPKRRRILGIRIIVGTLILKSSFHSISNAQPLLALYTINRAYFLL